MKVHRLGKCDYCDIDELPCAHITWIGSQQWACSREEGHDGPHIACGGSVGHVVAVWDRDGFGYVTSELQNRVWLSCPFCGESHCGFVTVVTQGFCVRCHSCGSDGPTRKLPNDARKAWNTRHAVWPADARDHQHKYESISWSEREMFPWEKESYEEAEN